MKLFTDKEPRVRLVPRDYQRLDHDETFRLWDSGERGVLTRMATGCGKTPVTCMKIGTWLERSDNNRAMIISYERDLVWQFALEIEDFLGITPGIEMGEDYVNPHEIPLVTVASRATLLPAKGPTPGQVKDLNDHGITDIDGLSYKLCRKFLKHLSNGGDEAAIHEEIERLKEYPEAKGASWSRLHKFPWQLNWLLVFDEAHRHAHSLKSVGHIVDWFDTNPNSKRSGLTATPKRGDGISIGHKMFPGVAIDYPLYHVTKPSAVTQGWAVPYLQKYIEVEGVDFKRIKQVAGDFDEGELERILGEEGQLAKLIEPLLDMVGERRTLIFSPGVAMANNVALYINARSQAECPACNVRKWYATKLIGEDSQCACGQLIRTEDIVKQGEQARSMYGGTSTNDRKTTYKAHQSGQFQFLSVCGLCREGYNDPDISCVAIFRPVSKKASSLAEQMKGRGCRPCRAVVPLLNELLTPEERVEAISTSTKPNCLIVDLVGITGLADCASTLQIYSDGLEDEVVAIAEGLLEEATEEEVSVEDAIKQAQKQVDDERERIKSEREEQQRQQKERASLRAKAKAEVRYTEHDVGIGTNTDANRASDGQYKLKRLLGMDIKASVSPRKAHRIIDMLKLRTDFAEVAYKNGIPADQWEHVGPSDKQLWALGQIGVHPETCKSGYDASQIIGAARNPGEFEQRKMQEINGSADSDHLTMVAMDISLARRVLKPDVYARLVEAGKIKRRALVR